jgi:uncharacterized protein (DUF433 family)
MIESPTITCSPKVIIGKPCIRGMQVTVGMFAGKIGSGTTIDVVLDDFPYLKRDDILEAIPYVRALASNAANTIALEDLDFDRFAIDLVEEVL